MKKLSVCIGIVLSLFVASCLSDPDTSDSEHTAIITTPEAQEVDAAAPAAKAITTSPDDIAPPEEGIITPGCDAPPSDPNRVCEGDGGGGGTGGGSGGGGGGSCTPGTAGCSGPVNCGDWVWHNVNRRCEHPRRGQTCAGPPDNSCLIAWDGTCQCIYIG